MAPPTKKESVSKDPDARKPGLATRAKNECVRCVNSYSKEDWAKLFFCYFIFYSVLTCWMSLHIAAMVSLLPDRESFCNSQTNYRGLRFCMGEPNYHSWLEKHVTYGNAEGVSQGIPSPEPWNTNGEPLKGVRNFGTRNYAFQQIRILNQYDLARMQHPGYGQRVQCQPANAADANKIIFTAFQNPFLASVTPAAGLPTDINSFVGAAAPNAWSSSSGNVFLNTTGNDGVFVTFANQESFTSGGITVLRGTSFTVTWTSPAQAPHIVQFMMTLNANAGCQGTAGEKISIRCDRLGVPAGYTGDTCTDCNYQGPEDPFSVQINQAGTMATSTCP
eukprot:m.18338 g.18338  ORF g.18338 m.18338 type:complete len:333 (-) comp3584_c0_seq1:1123-2121(-)